MKKTKSPDSNAESNMGQENTTGVNENATKKPAADTMSDNPEIEAGEPVTDPVQALRDDLAAKEKDFAALTDKYLRMAAEYDNFRRRSQKEKESLYVDSIVSVVKEWLPVLDNLDRAEIAAGQYVHEDVQKIAEGIAMIQKQAEQALVRLGVSKIECCGEPFNPELHEAVIHVEDDSVGASIVVAELQKGYRRDDRVIRHSMVKVAN